jgi:ribose transport system permease protein
MSAVAQPGGARALARRGLAPLREYGILVALVLMAIVVQVMNPEFITTDNLLNMGEQWAPIGIMAVGMTFVLIGGGFDLSVGATLALSATLSAVIAEQHAPGMAFGAVLLLGAAIGLVNGLLVTKLNVNPFVATLGVAQIVRGAALIYSDGGSVSISNGLYDWVGAGQIGTVPVPFMLMVVVMVVFGLILAYSLFGRALYAVGGNDEASFVSGIRTDRVRAATYVLSGVCAALAGAIYAGRIGTGQGNLAPGIELDVIAAALIGGISIAGGQGAIWRAAAGVALLAILQNFFNQQNIDSFWQLIFKGLIIITAVALDSYSKHPHRRSLRTVLGDLRFRARRAPGHATDVVPRR